jgi:hypothetical protein
MSKSDLIKPPYFLATLPQSQSTFAEPILSSRLAEFPTGVADPPKPHKEWLSTEVANLIRKTPGCWVSLYGHASMRGNVASNFALSRQRVDAVHATLVDALRGVSFDSYRDVPRGVADSGSNPSDNSGAFRAVEIFVYAPTTPRPERKRIDALVRKTTFKRVVTVQQWDPPDPGDKWAKAGKAVSDTMMQALILKMPNAAEAKKERIAHHPAERDLPDFAPVQSSHTDKVDDDQVLVAVDIDTTVTDHTEWIGFGNEKIVEVKQDYRYSYAQRPRETKAIVRRTVNSVPSPIFYIDQPVDYADP